MLGGHSMLGVQLAAKLRDAFGVKLTLRQLFTAPTIAALSAEVARLRDETNHDHHLRRRCPLSLYHLLDPEVLANPYPLYHRLRVARPGALGSVSSCLDRHAV